MKPNKRVAAIIAATVVLSAATATAGAAPAPRVVTVKSIGHDADGRYLMLSSGVKHYDEVTKADGYFDHVKGKVVCPAGWTLSYDFDANNHIWSACM